MTDLSYRAKAFRNRHWYNDGSPYGGRKPMEEDLLTELDWLDKNPPQWIQEDLPFMVKNLGKKRKTPEKVEIWRAAIAAVRAFLVEEKKK